MLAVKRLAGVAPEVNLKEHTSCTALPSVNKAVHSGFETQRTKHGSIKGGPVKGQIKKKVSGENIRK